MTFSSFVFDLDGTLVDSRDSIERSAQLAIAKVVPSFAGKPVTKEIGPPIREMFKNTMGEIDELTLDRLVASFRRAYDSGVCREAAPYEGVTKVLSAITRKGNNVYLLTNKPDAPTRQIVNHLGWDDFFGEIVTPDSADYSFRVKADALAQLIKRNRLQPTGVIMVGDSYDDAQAAETCEVAFGAAVYGYGDLLSAYPRKGMTLSCIEDILKYIA